MNIDDIRRSTSSTARAASGLSIERACLWSRRRRSSRTTLRPEEILSFAAFERSARSRRGRLIPASARSKPNLRSVLARGKKRAFVHRKLFRVTRDLQQIPDRASRQSEPRLRSDNEPVLSRSVEQYPLPSRSLHNRVS
jgi:hypothetical protein